MHDIKTIAIHLPQYHPIAENDIFWGKGFTEWTNVTKATSRFEGHYQPHLPADLGFYDLRLEEARMAQESLAKQYGIYGFCYYHYWFNGKKILEEPLLRKLQNKKEDLPFMLSWANENWTRTWDGLDKEILLKQDYSILDDIAHMEYLCDIFFKDHRYIKHQGKPVFLIYRPLLFPDISNTIAVWRDIARQKGIGELHLGYMQSWGVSIAPEKLGFDFAVEFQPKFPSPLNPKKSWLDKIGSRLKEVFLNLELNKATDRCFDYTSFVKLQMQNEFNANVSPCLTPMWDNSSRRKSNAFIFTNESPESYGMWLTHIKRNYPWTVNNEKFLFINAWNEWAEGNHLEPCQKWGNQYLEKTRQVLENE